MGTNQRLPSKRTRRHQNLQAPGLNRYRVDGGGRGADNQGMVEVGLVRTDDLSVEHINVALKRVYDIAWQGNKNVLFLRTTRWWGPPTWSPVEKGPDR